MKKNIHNAAQLKTAIAELEARKAFEETALKKQFHETYESLKPSNVLKNTLSEVSASPQFKHNLLNVALGIGAGFLSKKLVVGRDAGLLKRTLGSALQFAVTSLVAKRPENDIVVNKKRGSLLKRIFSGSIS
ncbi:MAG: hypothetical protein H0W12_09880 [Chitinophagaceae bacterium]|nr:hypothetical protein [Chitinophagaceae bacterium]